MSETFIAAELPRTIYFTHTLRRARTAAEQRRHRYVTLEHLLFALLDDPDALRLLEAAGADVTVIRSTISDAVNNRMAATAEPNAGPPAFSYKFDTLMLAAAEEAVHTGRAEIDGAIALLCVSKEPDSTASIFLLANGFDPSAGRKILGSPARMADRVSQQQPERGAPPSGGIEPAGGSMDDMLASVRNILDAEESARRRPPAPPPQALRQTYGTATGQGRLEPRFGDAKPEANGAGANPRDRIPDRNVKSFPGLSKRPLSPPDANSAPKKTPRGKPGRAAVSGERRPRPASLLDLVPKKIRAGTGRTVEIKMSKQECLALFDGVKGKNATPAQDTVVSRAITLRLTASSKGLDVLTLAPETQWIFDRPSFLDGEPFGRWVWTLKCDRGGKYGIALNVYARNIADNGVAQDAVLAEARTAIAVQTSYVRTLGRLLNTLFILCVGAGLATGALYALKILHILPNV